MGLPLSEHIFIMFRLYKINTLLKSDTISVCFIDFDSLKLLMIFLHVVLWNYLCLSSTWHLFLCKNVHYVSHAIKSSGFMYFVFYILYFGLGTPPPQHWKCVLWKPQLNKVQGVFLISHVFAVLMYDVKTYNIIFKSGFLVIAGVFLTASLYRFYRP